MPTISLIDTNPENSKFLKEFVSPEEFEKIKKPHSGPNGWLLFVPCNAGIDFAFKVKKIYDSWLKEKEFSGEVPILGVNANSRKFSPITQVFPDTETCPRLPDSVEGSNAFIFQCIHDKSGKNTVGENAWQLMQMVYTLQAYGAKTVNVVLPYHPYARQEKPTLFKREPITPKNFADCLIKSGAKNIITYHLHTEVLKGHYEPNAKLHCLTGLDLFIDLYYGMFKADVNVITVSVDAGGAKDVISFSGAMDLTYAISSKYRSSSKNATIIGICGDFQDKKIAILNDDETSTYTSLLNVSQILNKEYGIVEIYHTVSHNKLGIEYLDTLIEGHEKYGVKKIHFTNTIPQRKEFYELDFAETHCIEDRFAIVINRLHYNQPVRRAFYGDKDLLAKNNH